MHTKHARPFTIVSNIAKVLFDKCPAHTVYDFKNPPFEQVHSEGDDILWLLYVHHCWWTDGWFLTVSSFQLYLQLAPFPSGLPLVLITEAFYSVPRFYLLLNLELPLQVLRSTLLKLYNCPSDFSLLNHIQFKSLCPRSLSVFYCLVISLS